MSYCKYSINAAITTNNSEWRMRLTDFKEFNYV